MTRPETCLRIGLTGICALLLLSGETRAGPPETESLPGPVKVVLFEAQELRNEERFDEASAVIEEYLEVHPEHDGYYLRFHLGLSLEQGGRQSEAIEHYEAAVGMEVGQTEAWLRLATACYETGRYARAGEAFQAGFETGAEPDPTVLYYAGISFLMAGEGRRSFEAFSQLVSGVPGPPEIDVCKAYVAAAAEAEELEECIRVLHEVIFRNPGELEFWRLLYQAAGSMEDYRQAAVALTIIDYLKPLGSTELIQLADLYLALNIPARSTVYYERALGDTSSAAIRERLASAYVASHDPDKARRYLRDAVKVEPTPRLWSLLGDLDYFEERYEEALGSYRASATLDPDPARAYLMMAYCAYELDRPAEARMHARKAAGFEETREPAQRLLNSLNGLPRGG